MKLGRVLSIAFVLLLAVTTTNAQKGKLKRAQSAIEELNYIGAIDILNQILQKKDNPEAKKMIADSYRKISDTENAEYWYSQVVLLADAKPLDKLYYGQMLQRNGKCEEASTWYDSYLEAVPNDVRGQFLSKACDYENELMTKNVGIYNVEHLNINSNLDDFGPVINDGKLLFSSERDRGSAVKRLHCWTGNPFLELYEVDRREASSDDACKSYDYGRVEKYDNKFNSKFHDAAIAFADSGEEMYFTRNNIVKGKTSRSDDGVVKLKVFRSNKKGDSWGELESLPFNSDEYSVAHPALSADGTKLFFASDMPGGYGNMDLYYADRDGDRWGAPVNLGPKINTEGQELFPFIKKDGTIHFASDGHIGLGGLDIFSAPEDGMSFGAITNLGYPINTRSDDFGLIFEADGRNGYFSSDREGGLGRDDIYGFCKTAIPLEVLVYDCKTEEPIPGAIVIDDCTGQTYTTNADGIALIDMKLDQCCNFTASFAGYTEDAKEQCSTDVGDMASLKMESPICPVQQCDIEGIVFDDGTGLPLAGALVTLANDCGTDEQTMTTDESGRYYFLLDEGCDYTVRGSKMDYFAATASDLSTKDLIECYTLNANLNVQPTKGNTTVTTDPYPGSTIISTEPQATGVWKNADTGIYHNPDGTIANFEGENGVSYRDGIRYVDGERDNSSTTDTGFERTWTDVQADEQVSYLLHIYYDFDKSSIRPEARPELDKLCRLLNENPEYIIEVGAHTDSRGSKGYNMTLSERRAKAVTKWLTNNCGIDPSRLYARGYGESAHVNGCTDRIPCSEMEHQINRRTEFKVIGCLGCVTGDQAKLSRPKANPRVDSCIGCPF